MYRGACGSPKVNKLTHLQSGSRLGIVSWIINSAAANRQQPAATTQSRCQKAEERYENNTPEGKMSRLTRLMMYVNRLNDRDNNEKLIKTSRLKLAALSGANQKTLKPFLRRHVSST